jgi:hypothetical protein
MTTSLFLIAECLEAEADEARKPAKGHSNRFQGLRKLFLEKSTVVDIPKIRRINSA